jgi:Protein of unknown function (DUF2892)
MLPDTNHRVADSTCDFVNEQIREQTSRNIAKYANASREEITRRLEELDQEWDIERTLQANAASFSLTGLLLGATVDRKWFIFPGVVAAFLLQHAVQGWCPPLPVFRRMGIRTSAEINEERYALKVLRGDFDRVVQREQSAPDARKVFAAARQ